MPAKIPGSSSINSFALSDPASMGNLIFPAFPEPEPTEVAATWEAQTTHSRTLRQWGASNLDSLTHSPMNPERFVLD